MICYTGLDRLASDKRFSLWGLFVSYMKKATATVFMTFHFLHNLRMDPISKNVNVTLGWTDLPVTNTLAYWVYL
jgi:hypothetical protein